MAEECKRFHSRRAELLSIEKGYAPKIAEWYWNHGCRLKSPLPFYVWYYSAYEERIKRQNVNNQKNHLSRENVMAAIM